jgi:hypothetical protein
MKPCQLVISYRRFKDASSSETQLIILPSTWCNVPQDSQRQNRCENLKSRVFQSILFTSWYMARTPATFRWSQSFIRIWFWGLRCFGMLTQNKVLVGNCDFYCKSNPCAGLESPWEFQEAEAPRFQYYPHMKMLRLSALHTGRIYPPGNIPGTHFCWRLSQPQGHSAAGRIMSMKISNDSIGNRNRDLPACTASS